MLPPGCSSSAAGPSGGSRPGPRRNSCAPAGSDLPRPRGWSLPLNSLPDWPRSPVPPHSGFGNRRTSSVCLGARLRDLSGGRVPPAGARQPEPGAARCPGYSRTAQQFPGASPRGVPRRRLPRRPRASSWCTIIRVEIPLLLPKTVQSPGNWSRPGACSICRCTITSFWRATGSSASRRRVCCERTHGGL